MDAKFWETENPVWSEEFIPHYKKNFFLIALFLFLVFLGATLYWSALSGNQVLFVSQNLPFIIGSFTVALLLIGSILYSRSKQSVNMHTIVYPSGLFFGNERAYISFPWENITKLTIDQKIVPLPKTPGEAIGSVASGQAIIGVAGNIAQAVDKSHNLIIEGMPSFSTFAQTLNRTILIIRDVSGFLNSLHAVNGSSDKMTPAN